MKKNAFWGCLLFILGLTCSAIGTAGTIDAINALTPDTLAAASADTVKRAPLVIPSAPTLDVKAYVLLDANSLKVLASQNPDTPLPPASLTKLMTIYIAFDALKHGQIKLSDPVTVSQKAWRTGGSRMFLNPGQQVTVGQLLDGIIIDSGNDAAVALAEFIGGTEETFTDLMNQQAKRLGMKNSHFTDCNGLPHPDHYVSADDFGILTAALIKNFPEYYALFAQKAYTFNKIKQHNRNRLLWRYDAADGLKTGHTEEAGYCLVASAKKNGMRLITVVMGAPSDKARTADSIALLNYGFRFYQTYHLYAANQTITDARVWGGTDKRLPVGLPKTLFVTVPAGQYDKLSAKAVLKNPINAPVEKGESLGTLQVTFNDKLVRSEPLLALRADSSAGWIGRLLDKVAYTVHKTFHKAA